MNTKSLDADLAVLSDSIAKVLANECERRAVHEFFDSRNGLDENLWAQAVEQGWLGIGLPEEYGGLDFGAPGLDVLYRQLGRAMAPGVFISTLAAAQWLAEVGTEELKQKLLPDVIAGTCAFAVPLVPHAAPLALQDGQLTGQTALMVSTRAPAIVVVPVQTNGALAYALVDVNANAEFAPADIWDRGHYIGRFSFHQAKPIALIADPSGQVTDALRRNLCLAVAAESVGSARVITEQTVEYLKERSQFGRPLASFQALKHRVADLLTAVVQAESMLEQAVDATANAEPSAAMWADLAKASAAEKFKFVAEDCVQLYGGVGFTWEFDCHIFLKRALLNREIAGSGGSLRDRAAKYFAESVRAGISTAELTL